MNAELREAVDLRFKSLWPVEPPKQCCPACRGYRLERQWCHLCDGKGYITAHLGGENND